MNKFYRALKFYRGLNCLINLDQIMFYDRFESSFGLMDFQKDKKVSFVFQRPTNVL